MHRKHAIAQQALERPALQLLPPVERTPASNNAARSLLMDLRSGRRPVKSAPAVVPPAAAAVPVIPSLEELRTATPRPQPPASRPAAADRMGLNNILLTAGADETAGTIRIPNLLQADAPAAAATEMELRPTPAVATQPVLQNSVKRVRTTKRGVTRFFNWGNTVTIFNRKKGTTRTRGRLIEFYDPEDERPDVDDYDMPILLVAAQEPKTPVQELDEDDGDRLLKRKLTDIQPTLAYAWGDKDEDDLPKDFYKQMDNGEYMVAMAPRTVLQWEPTNLWYYPLYFEDPGLERYGHTRHEWVQPFVSTGRFFKQVATLPYHMALNSPKSPQYALGYYQPGEWAPKKRYQVPFNEEATATQFLVMTALILLIP